MVETNNIYPNLPDHQFRLHRINENKDYFVTDIKKREPMSKRLREYISSLDYFDMSSIVFSIKTGSVSIAIFAAVIGAPVETVVQVLVMYFQLLQES